jgi:glycerol kinase
VGDQQAAPTVRDAGEGEGKNTYGTGAFSFNATIRPGWWRTADDDRLRTLRQPAHVLEAAIFAAERRSSGRDGLQIIASAPETEALAESLDSNDGVYFVPALVGLAAPHWEAAARGTVVGLTRGTSRAHLARAALEAMAYGTADVVKAVREHGGVDLDRLRVDGGATSNNWLMQFQADLLGIPVERPDMAETTALGAAGLAGIGAGVWASPDEFLAAHRFTSFTPQRGRAAALEAYAGWGRAVRATLSWARDAGV